MASLKITAIPFRSSNLARIPSPFSPRSPLTPLPQHSGPSKNSRVKTYNRCDSTIPHLHSQAPAVKPLSWRWKCHTCRTFYPIGVTRRCLEDGHTFCNGTSTSTFSTRPRTYARRHKACASEFDYASWKRLGDWKRGGFEKGEGGKRMCWRNCDYPSQCRWGDKLAHLQREETWKCALPVVELVGPVWRVGDVDEALSGESMVAEGVVHAEEDSMVIEHENQCPTLEGLLRAGESILARSKQQLASTLETVLEEQELDSDIQMIEDVLPAKVMDDEMLDPALLLPGIESSVSDWHSVRIGSIDFIVG